MKSIHKSGKLDQLGITASILCAIHCAALPLIITALPLMGLGFLANIWVEISMIALSLIVGISSLSTSYPKHKKQLPILILILGFMFIGAGHFIFKPWEAAVVPAGGFLIATAHLVNWKYSKTCQH